MLPESLNAREDTAVAPSNGEQRKPRLLVILGAGSSISCGMPSVGEIDKLMRRWAREWKPEPPVDSETDVFNLLWGMAESYYGRNHYCIRPNYEMVLGEMTALASWVSPPPFGNPLIRTLESSAPAAALAPLLECSNPNHARNLIVGQQVSMFESLVAHMRERSNELEVQSPEFLDYQRLLLKLREHFELGIYNLNYDTVALNAWPKAFLGFDGYGKFDPVCVNQRRDWGFIYHLHGSVHHCISHRISRPWIVWKDNLEDTFCDSGVPQAGMAQGFRPMPPTTLIAGGFKLDQLLPDPYQTYYSSLVRNVHEANAILLGGYGFGDLHVNRALRNRFEGPDDVRPHPRVVILAKSCPERYRTARLEGHQFWSWELTHTLKTTFADGSGFPSKDDRRVGELIERDEFETDRTSRTAIWHDGFCEALRAADRVTEWLLRGL